MNSKRRLEAARTFLPRTMRFSVAARELRNAAATSLTLKPQRMLRMRATWAGSFRRGWQQENIMRSSSS